MIKNKLLIYKFSHLKCLKVTLHFHRNKAQIAVKLVLIILLGDVIMVDVILLPEELLKFLNLYLFVNSWQR